MAAAVAALLHFVCTLVFDEDFCAVAAAPPSFSPAAGVRFAPTPTTWQPSKVVREVAAESGASSGASFGQQVLGWVVPTIFFLALMAAGGHVLVSRARAVILVAATASAVSSPVVFPVDIPLPPSPTSPDLAVIDEMPLFVALVLSPLAAVANARFASLRRKIVGLSLSVAHLLAVVNGQAAEIAGLGRSQAALLLDCLQLRAFIHQQLDTIAGLRDTIAGLLTTVAALDKRIEQLQQQDEQREQEERRLRHIIRHLVHGGVDAVPGAEHEAWVEGLPLNFCLQNISQRGGAKHSYKYEIRLGSYAKSYKASIVNGWSQAVLKDKPHHPDVLDYWKNEWDSEDPLVEDKFRATTVADCQDLFDPAEGVVVQTKPRALPPHETKPESA